MLPVLFSKTLFFFFFSFLTALGANSDWRFFLNMLQPPIAIAGAGPQIRSCAVRLLKQKFDLLVRKLKSCRLSPANTWPERVQHAALVKRNTQPGGGTRAVRTEESFQLADFPNPITCNLESERASKRDCRGPARLRVTRGRARYACLISLIISSPC